jgi:putative peptide zinc metalloprotease protein
LEPRRRRLAITAAGPASDFTLGGLFALGALAVGDGALRDVLFQVAFGGYVGALVNLNPVLDRDGYHLLVDWLREPGLRGRARTWLRRRLAGAAAPAETRLVAVYAAGGLLWSVVAVGLVALLASRYAEPLERHLPAEVVSAGVALVCALMLLPVLVTVLGPLLQRRAAGG